MQTKKKLLKKNTCTLQAKDCDEFNPSFIYFQESEFSGSAFGYHKNSDPETHTPGNNKE